MSKTSFKDFHLDKRIDRALCLLKYDHPTPIQEKSIPHVMGGKDLLGTAQTGTGKTAAFALPLIHRLLDHADHVSGSPRALILTPTRELAVQVADNIKAYSRFTKLKTVMIFGGVGIEPQKQALRKPTDIVVATPGRLIDLMRQRCIDLSHVHCCVLDEADRMLDMGFLPDVKRIFEKLPTDRQNLLFSATMPKDIQNLVERWLCDPLKVTVAPRSAASESVRQKIYLVETNDKRHLLLDTLVKEDVKRALVFTRTKALANRVSDFLTKSGVSAEAIHGNKSQSARQRSLNLFKSGKLRVLVASDLAARGIDVSDISHVINYNIPNVPETYVHRIGRTGRASARGIAISLCDSTERGFVRSIERTIGKRIPIDSDHPYVADEKQLGKPVVAEVYTDPGRRAQSRRFKSRRKFYS